MNTIIFIIILLIAIISFIFFTIIYSSSNKSNFGEHTQRIPKIIWQISKDEKMTNIFENNIKKLKRMNSEYKYNILYEKDAKKFILKYYNEGIWKIYNSINECYGPARGDLLRYLLLYKFGGVYFDLKSYPKKPLREIISTTDEYLLSSWIDSTHEDILETGYGEYQNWFIMTKPSHIFLKNVIEDVCNNILNYKENWTGKKGVLLLTGPIIYTQSIIKTKEKGHRNYRFIPNDLNFSVKYSDGGNTHYDEHSEKLNKHNYKHYSKCTDLIIDKNKLK